MISNNKKIRLLRSFLVVAAVMEATVFAAHAQMVLIPGGEFIMGSDKQDSENKAREMGTLKPWYADERPLRKQFLPAFYLDQYEVTNAQYLRFVRDKDYEMPTTWYNNGYLLAPPILRKLPREVVLQHAWNTFELDGNLTQLNDDELIAAMDEKRRTLDTLPVGGVTWQNARDYCDWAGKRLPSEAEWEKAARGVDGAEFPWGDKWEESRLNASGQTRWTHGVAPVGSYPQGRSPFGVDDMAGNVMEWVADWYGPYPETDYTSQAFGARYKVVRGGGWGGVGHYAISHLYRTAYRFYLDPMSAFGDLGFRCAKQG